MRTLSRASPPCGDQKSKVSFLAILFIVEKIVLYLQLDSLRATTYFVCFLVENHQNLSKQIDKEGVSYLYVRPYLFACWAFGDAPTKTGLGVHLFCAPDKLKH